MANDFLLATVNLRLLYHVELLYLIEIARVRIPHPSIMEGLCIAASAQPRKNHEVRYAVEVDVILCYPLQVSFLIGVECS